MAMNIEQRLEQSAKSIEQSSQKAHDFAEKDTTIQTCAGSRDSLPKVSRIWQENFARQMNQHATEFQERFALSQQSLPWQASITISDSLQRYHVGVQGEEGYKEFLPNPLKLPFETAATLADDLTQERWLENGVPNKHWTESKVASALEKSLGVNARIWPKDRDLQVGDVIPSAQETADGLPITHLVVNGNVYAMSPLASGLVTALSSTGMVVEFSIVNLIPPEVINKSVVDYLDFGANPNDPSFDNYPFIKLAHDYANKTQKPVKPTSGVYNIGALPEEIGIKIKTDCDWSGSKFRLTSASSSDTLYSRKRLFSCLSDTIATLLPAQINIADFVEGASSLPSVLSLGYSNVVIAIYSNDRYLLRNGDSNQTIYKQELCAVFENGKLTSPLQFTYNSITKIEVYPFESYRLKLKNLSFLLEDDFKSAIGLHLQRNNTDLEGVFVEEPDNTNKNYSRNFINLFNNYNSKIDLLLGNGFETGGGTYLIRPELTESCEIRGIKAINGWGVFGGNFNKNIKYIDCETNRIDQHALGQDCIIERCSIYDNSGVSVTGKGKLSINNCRYYIKANGANLVTLRSDYASIWDGEIHLTNTKLVVSLENPAQAELNINIIEADILNIDFGVDHIFPDVFVDGLSIDSDASTTLVTCYNLPFNKGVNNQYLPRLAKFHNIITKSENVRVRAAPTLVADQPKYRGDGMKFDLKNLPMDYNWVHSASFDISKDAILRLVGANYSTGTPFNFSAEIDSCDNCGFVWTVPSPLKVSKSNRLSALMTRAGNSTGLSFNGVKNAVFIYDSSCELMNYRGNQEFMIEDVNIRNLEFIKPSYNSEVGGYRSVKLNTIVSSIGSVMRTDCPVIPSDESLVAQIFAGIKKSDWR
ncbi:hypothetical protein NTH50_000392 [Vibrio mimicus]